MEDILSVQKSKDISLSTELPTGETPCFWTHFVTRGGDLCGTTVLNDRSNSLTYRFVGPSEPFQERDFGSLIHIYLNAADKYIAFHSGLKDWPRRDLKTLSPEVDEDKITLLLNKLATAMVSTGEKMNEKRIKLNEKYLREKQKYFHYFDGVVDEDYLDKFFKTIIDKIIHLPYEAIAVEITKDKGLYFDMRWADLTVHFKLILSEPLEPKGFFAIYKNSLCVDNGVGPINDIIDHLLDSNAGVSRRTVTEELL